MSLAKIPAAPDDLLASVAEYEQQLEEALRAVHEFRAVISDGPSVVRRESRPGSVSDTKLQAVREYIKRHSEVRQADIVKDLKMNAGSVSNAVRKLADSGEIVLSNEKKARAYVWKWAGEPARVTEVTPGVGLSVGRLAR